MESFRFTHKRAPSLEELAPHREMERGVKILSLKESYAKERIAMLAAKRSEKCVRMQLLEYSTVCLQETREVIYIMFCRQHASPDDARMAIQEVEMPTKQERKRDV